MAEYVINTVGGRVATLEERNGGYAVAVSDTVSGDRDIRTTKGMLKESALTRRVLFEDRLDEFVVSVEWREGDELVRRDAHVILKRVPDAALAAAGGVGG